MTDLATQFVIGDCQLGHHPKIRASVFTEEHQKFRLLARVPPSADYIALRQGDLAAATSRMQQHAPADAYIHIRSIEETKAADITGRRVPFSIVSLPLLHGSGVTGALCLEADERDYFDERRVASGQLLAALISYLLVAPWKEPPPSAVSVELARAMRVVRRVLGLTQEETARRAGISRIALSRWEQGGQPPSPGQLVRWCMALGLLAPRSEAIVRTLALPERLLERLQKEPNLLQQLSPEEFEIFVAERLDSMGFDVTITREANLRDGGIDLIAVPKIRTVGTFLLGGQVKHHRGNRKTGRDAVDRLAAWQGSAFNLGLLVTNTAFTRDAKWLAEQAGHQQFLRLRDFDDIRRWIAGRFWDEEEWREIPDDIHLAPGIVVPVPRLTLSAMPRIWPLTEVKRQL